MAKHSRRHNSRRRHISRGRRMKGGSYTSATTYGEYVNGSPASQFSRVFDQGGSYGQVPGNIIIGAQGQNIQPTSQMPTQSQLNLIANDSQQGGRRRRKKGGFLGEVVNQAIVPFALLGMQNTYRRRKGGRRRTHRRRH